MYFEDVDEIFNKAQKEGATVIMPLMDAFSGDRYGHLKDPFGHIWEVATHKKDMTKEEMERAAKEAFAKMAADNNAKS
jgi:PhnB protein